MPSSFNHSLLSMFSTGGSEGSLVVRSWKRITRIFERFKVILFSVVQLQMSFTQPELSNLLLSYYHIKYLNSLAGMIGHVIEVLRRTQCYLL